MATPAEIARFKLLIGGTTLTDEQIGLILDNNEGNLNLSGYEYWIGISGNYAHLVSMSENGSSRSMSDLHKHALAQAAFFRSQADAEVAVTTRVTNTRPIVRP